MVKIKTLRAHDNSYGDKFHKEKGDVYEHPAPQSLIDNTLAEIVHEKNSEDRGPEGAGEGSSGASENDATKHFAKGTAKAG